MKILKFKKAQPPQPPRVKHKRKPRLRVVASDRDVRLTKTELQTALDAWLPTLGKHTVVVTDNKYVCVYISCSDRHMPVMTYRVTRWTGDVHEVMGSEVKKFACMDVVRWTYSHPIR